MPDYTGIFLAQEPLLKAFGFFPLNPIKATKRGLTFKQGKYFVGLFGMILGTALILGGILSVLIYILPVIWKLVTVPDDTDIVTNFMDFGPYCAINVQGVFVLIVCFSRRSQWLDIKEQLDKTILLHFSDAAVKTRYFIKWRSISGLFGITLPMLVILWEVGDWMHYQATDPIYKDMWNDTILDPMPLKMTVWSYITLWTVCCSFPFLLSQLIYSTAALMGCVLCDCLKQFNGDIEIEITRFELTIPDSVLSSSLCSVRNTAVQELREMRERYMQMVNFCESFVEYYETTLLVIYGLDVLTICGFVSKFVVIKASERITAGYAMDSCTLIIFTLYIFLLLPVIAAQEEADKIPLYCSRFANTVLALLENEKEGYQLRVALEGFITLVRDQPLTFSGIGTLSISRKLLAGTVTFVMSWAVFLHEFKEKHDGKTSSATNSCISHSLNAANPRY